MPVATIADLPNQGNETTSVPRLAFSSGSPLVAVVPC